MYELSTMSCYPLLITRAEHVPRFDSMSIAVSPTNSHDHPQWQACLNPRMARARVILSLKDVVVEAHRIAGLERAEWDKGPSSRIGFVPRKIRVHSETCKTTAP